MEGTVLVHPDDTTTGVWIVQNETTLHALSGCCQSGIWWDTRLGRWNCSNCRTDIANSPGGKVGSSEYWLNIHHESDPLNIWASQWVGKEVEVSIDGS